MTPLPAPLRWLHSLEWRRGFFDWARSDGVTWVYIFKVLIAAFLTLWLAMRLELPQPRTAMITVFIVMQPQSGHVFAKSFYRVLGTLAGSAMMVALIAIFPQNTELFLPSLAIWVGICSAGAMRYRNFRAYGFVLAGYTAAMVGLPALAHPDGAFMAAVWRVLEISLGILCSTLISAAILPQTASAAMRIPSTEPGPTHREKERISPSFSLASAKATSTCMSRPLLWRASICSRPSCSSGELVRILL